jgi:RNA polymerase sigma factor (sigma-70 family)
MRRWLSRLRASAPPPTLTETHDPGPVSGPRSAPPRPSYDDIFRSKHRYVLGTLWRLGIERECDREDIAQEVFLVVLRRLDEYDPTLKIEAWLGRITWFKALQWRQLYRNHREQLRAEGVEEDDERDDDARNPEAVTHAQRYAWALLQTLSDERQIVFLLHEQDGVSLLDIARAFELPKGTVETRLKLARRDLLAAARRMRAKDRSEAGAHALPLVIPTSAALLANDPGGLLDVLRTVPEVPAGTTERLWRHLEHARDGWAGGGSGNGGARSPSTPTGLRGPGLPSRAGLARAGRALLLSAVSATAGGGGVYLLLRRAPEPTTLSAPVEVNSARASVSTDAGSDPVAMVTASVDTRPTASPPDAGPEPSDPLDTDAALMRRAMAALGDGQPGAALALAQRHAKKYPGSRRVQEREALAIRALVGLGRRAEAQAHAESFRRSYPQSILLNAIDSALGPPPPKP